MHKLLELYKQNRDQPSSLLLQFTYLDSQTAFIFLYIAYINIPKLE